MKKCLLCNAEMVKLTQEYTIGRYEYTYPNGKKVEPDVQSYKYFCPNCLFVMEFVDEQSVKKMQL